jgi:hypothetical protein
MQERRERQDIIFGTSGKDAVITVAAPKSHQTTIEATNDALNQFNQRTRASINDCSFSKVHEIGHVLNIQESCIHASAIAQYPIAVFRSLQSESLR